MEYPFGHTEMIKTISSVDIPLHLFVPKVGAVEIVIGSNIQSSPYGNLLVYALFPHHVNSKKESL